MDDNANIVPIPKPIEPLSLIEAAIAKGVDADQLGKLMDLQERHAKAVAVEAFNKAFTAFKAEAPHAILRTGRVGYDGKGGGRTEYRHVELDHAVDTLVPILARHELTHRWEPKQENGLIAVTCHLEHPLGHSRSATLIGAADSSGSKNPIQAIGSAVYYLERYTFLAVTGMAAKNQDDDAGGVMETLSSAEIAELQSLVNELTSPEPFFDWLKALHSGSKITNVGDVSRKNFKTVKDKLVKKVAEIRAREKAGAK